MIFLAAAMTLTSAVDPVKQLQVVADAMHDLLITIEKEEQDEIKNYDCFTQWCAEEKATRSKEIDEQSLALEDLRVTADQSEAAIAKNSYVVDENKKDIKELSSALEQAQGIRNDERLEYEKDREINTMSVKQLESAIGIVGKVNQLGFLQENNRLTAPQESSFVTGVFRSLKHNMERNQSAADKDETRRQNLYDRMASQKTSLMHNIQEDTEKKIINVAETQQALVQATNEIKSTKDVRVETKKYRKETAESCAQKEREWRVRQSDRAKEKTAIREAISFLKIAFSKEKRKSEKTEADAPQDSPGHAALSFLQLNPFSMPLESDNLESPSTSLSALSTQMDQFVSGDQFRGVKKKIIELVNTLEREQAEDKQKKVRCDTTEETQKADFVVKMDKMAQLESMISRKTELIKSLTSGIEEIKSLMKEAKKANEDVEKLRKDEHKVFVKGTKERKLALKVLKQAKVVLKKFYETKDKTALTQVHDTPRTSAPTSSRHEGEANIVLSMLDKITDDIVRENREAAQLEHDSQAAFEKHQANAVKEFDIRIEKITHMSSRRAKSSVQLDNHKEDGSLLEEKIDAIRGKIRALVEECGEFLHTYDEREKARGFEIAQLKDAHGIFSGAMAAVRTDIN
eukprot:GEMP01022360.1.p1 GENE.GEMP01022360.1~~GEMP01022360.1.p1  ORF type:complete len:631 (+),score=196.85 GEMP01022360.1:416-2308(+)